MSTNFFPSLAVPQRSNTGLVEGHLIRTVRVSQHGGWDAPQTTQEPLRISAPPTTFIASIQSVPDKKVMDALSVTLKYSGTPSYSQDVNQPLPVPGSDLSDSSTTTTISPSSPEK